MLQTLGELIGYVPLLEDIRRNHALEHATVHMLSRRVRGLKAAGYSLPGGFAIVGALETELVEDAAAEALARLRRGEAQWALHPNCGTSLLTTGLMATLASLFSLQINRRPEERLLRLPTAVLLTMTAMILSRPLGLNIQRHVTTQANMGTVSVARVVRLTDRPVPVHWVETAPS